MTEKHRFHLFPLVGWNKTDMQDLPYKWCPALVQININCREPLKPTRKLYLSSLRACKPSGRDLQRSGQWITSAMMSVFGLPLRLRCHTPETSNPSTYAGFSIYMDATQHTTNLSVTNEINMWKHRHGFFDNTWFTAVHKNKYCQRDWF